MKIISGSSAVECPGMLSSHEESDTRMILHDIQADVEFRNRNTIGGIMIKSSDTDVLVLYIHFLSPDAKH